MRSQFTIIRRHGRKEFEIAVGPELEPRCHRTFIKPLRASRKNPEIAELYVAVVNRRMKFDPTGSGAPPPKRTLVQKVLDVVTPKAQPKVNGPKPKSFNTPKLRKSAFAARVAATQTPLQT